MKFFYFDESEGTLDGKKYTAVSGVGISAEGLQRVRKIFYPELDALLFGRYQEGQERIVRAPVPLHGSDLLREFEDEKKTAAVQLLFKTFSDNGAEFIRLGYFDDSIKLFGAKKEERVNFCLHNVLLMFERDVGGLFAFVHEMDREALRKGFKFVNEQHGRYYNALQFTDETNFTVDFKNFLGHYVAGPEDIGCQMADLVGYCAAKASNGESVFAKGLSGLIDQYADRFLENIIIEMRAGQPESR